MPSSDDEQRYGTIFMGPTPDRETTLDKLYAVAKRDVWNKRTEDEYMERIKARATEQVRALLLQARKRGDEIMTQAESKAGSIRAEGEQFRAESDALRQAAQQELEKARVVTDDAEALRENARQEGFQAGHEEALAQLALDRQSLGETTAVVLISIQEQCARIFDAWRDDLSDLLREAVSKSTAWVVDEARAEVLNAVLDQSVRALLDKRHFTVRVNPADAALVTDLLVDAHKAGSRTLSWELGTDPALEPGSLIVESDAALVDNSRKARHSVVDEVLKNLSLPAGQVDQDAFEHVTNTLVSEMRQHGIDLQDPNEGQEQAEFTPPNHDFGQNAEFSQPDLTPKEDKEGPTDLYDAAQGDEQFPIEPAPFDPAPFEPSMVDAPSDLMPEFNANPAGNMPPDVSAEAAEFSSPFDPTSIFDNPPAKVLASPEAVEAEDMVAEFLAEPAHAANFGANHDADSDVSDNALPPDVADDLLAEMGFGPNTTP